MAAHLEGIKISIALLSQILSLGEQGLKNWMIMLQHL